MVVRFCTFWTRNLRDGRKYPRPLCPIPWLKHAPIPTASEVRRIMPNSYYQTLISYGPEWRREVKAIIDRHMQCRVILASEPSLPCPDSHCRQYRLYIETDIRGRPDCPLCSGTGWVLESTVLGTPPPKRRVEKCYYYWPRGVEGEKS